MHVDSSEVAMQFSQKDKRGFIWAVRKNENQINKETTSNPKNTPPCKCSGWSRAHSRLASWF